MLPASHKRITGENARISSKVTKPISGLAHGGADWIRVRTQEAQLQYSIFIVVWWFGDSKMMN
jgi:hypothetical protein